MIQKTLISLTILLALSGCQDAKENQATHDAKIAAEAKAELRAELKKEQEEKARQKELEIQKNNTYAHIGFSTEDGKVIIDTEKTKSYFKQMAAQLKAHADKFSEDFEKGVINEEEAGIEVNATHINIDLNKTKSFLDAWTKTIKGYAKEFETMTKEIDTSK